MQDDSITIEKESKPHTFYHPNSSSLHESYIKQHQRGATPTKERNIIDEPFKPSESNHHSHHHHHNNKFPPNNNNNNNINNNRFFDRPPHLDSLKNREYAVAAAATYEVKRRELETFDALHHRHNHIASSNNNRDHSPHRYESPLYSLPLQGRNGLANRLSAEPPHLRVETTTDGGVPSPLGSTLSPNRKRPRPGPIIIPAAVNNRSIPTTISPSRHLSFPKGIYTPPAMLSPRSIFFNPPFAPRHGYQTTPVTTPGRMQLGKRRTCKCCLKLVSRFLLHKTCTKEIWIKICNSFYYYRVFLKPCVDRVVLACNL